jgi:hypothetical protein
MKRPQSIAVRVSLGLTGFVTALILAMAAITLLARTSEVVQPSFKLERLAVLENRLRKISDSSDSPGKLRIAYLGDSTVEDIWEDSLPIRLERALKKHYRRLDHINASKDPISIEVHNLALPAMSNITYHFIAREIAEADPDLIVWQTSFTHTSETWLKIHTIHEFAGLLPFRDLFRIAQFPIQSLGMTLDDLLFYKLLMASDVREEWLWLKREQSHIESSLDNFRVWVARLFGKEPDFWFKVLRQQTTLTKRIQILEGRRRYRGDTVIEHLGRGLAGLPEDHVSLRFLGESLATFREAEIPVVVYLNPINVEHLDTLGLRDRGVLERGAGQFRTVVLATDSRFLDLHDLLPDAGFRDEKGNYDVTNEIDALKIMVGEISPIVIDALGPIARRHMNATTGSHSSRKNGPE